MWKESVHCSWQQVFCVKFYDFHMISSRIFTCLSCRLSQAHFRHFLQGLDCVVLSASSLQRLLGHQQAHHPHVALHRSLPNKGNSWGKDGKGVGHTAAREHLDKKPQGSSIFLHGNQGQSRPLHRFGWRRTASASYWRLGSSLGRRSEISCHFDTIQLRCNLPYCSNSRREICRI